MLTLSVVEKALPANLRSFASQALVDRINSSVADPIIAEQIQQNFISYTGVLRDGKYKTDDYLSAVMYVSYKLMGNSNQDAYFKTFPQRHAALLAKGTSVKDISAYVAAYARGQLVNKIMEQTIVPSWVLNQHMYQEALNTQADLMINARSEMVRATAANSILTHLTKPKEVGPLINLNIGDTSGMAELKDLLRNVAVQQREAIQNGVPTHLIAAQKIIDVTIDETAENV